MHRILLLGATGFLGTHIHRQLLDQRTAEVTTVARSPLAESARHICLDLATADLGTVCALLAETGADTVVNCAGALSGSPAVLAATNVDLPALLAQAALCRQFPPRLVQLGSAAEYGRVLAGVPITEHSPTTPVGVYGVSKLAATRLVGLARAAGLDAVVLRVFDPVGPGTPAHSLCGRLADLVRTAAYRDEQVDLGRLDTVRDFVDVRDVASAVCAAVTAPVLDQPVLNVGSGIGMPVGALANALTGIARSPGVLRHHNSSSDRSAAIPWQQADIGAIRRSLGWRPTIDLATSLLDLWQEAECPA